ncbi:hypothetical protein M422DRAFT_65790 [Sphaerobolus stellatus SS14]|nr:hypothetical protein M422DRAFT_65790 [Sphaerobolus stellatus SS14]
MSEMEELDTIFEELGEDSYAETAEETTTKELEKTAEEEAEMRQEIEDGTEKNPVTDNPEFKESAEEYLEEVKSGKVKITQSLKELMKNMWDKKGAFAKFVGAEVAKGALFSVGMEAVQKLMEKKATENPSPTNITRSKIISAIADSLKKSNNITSYWKTWTLANFDRSESFGSHHDEEDDVDISLYQIFQKKSSDLTDTLGKLTPYLTRSSKNKDVTSAEEYLVQFILYIRQEEKLAQFLSTQKKMLDAGLKHRRSDVEDILATLTALATEEGVKVPDEKKESS